MEGFSVTADWTSPSVAVLENKELELVQQHEELIKKREALLRTTQCYYDFRRNQPESFVTDIHTANQRNEVIRAELNARLDSLSNRRTSSRRLTTLKNNYWVMVQQIFPVWLEEHNEYEHRKSNPIADKFSASRNTTQQQQKKNTESNESSSAVIAGPRRSTRSPTRSRQSVKVLESKSSVPSVHFSFESVDRSNTGQHDTASGNFDAQQRDSLVSTGSTNTGQDNMAASNTPSGARRNSELSQTRARQSEMMRVRQTDYSLMSPRSRSASVGSAKQSVMLDFR